MTRNMSRDEVLGEAVAEDEDGTRNAPASPVMKMIENARNDLVLANYYQPHVTL